jgi:asparagine synthase (glutamine-hydrolysing)
MCGLAGYLQTLPSAANSMRAALDPMLSRIVHRGPDSEGMWIDAEQGIALGHRRLAIIDVSPAGAQPMISHRGRYVIAFNGEIYNHLDIRRELAGSGSAPPWRGHSDTETLLAGIEAWGLEATLCKAVGSGRARPLARS